MVRCATIGTSNSIMKDCFVWHLSHSPDVSLSLRGGLLGASPSAIGPYFAASDDFFKDCDYCLIDLCVIDLTVVNGKTADLLSILQWVEWIGHTARKNGCQPIFVLIPVIEYATQPHPVFDLYRSIIAQQRYFFLDVRELIQNIVQGDNAKIEPLYKDGAHLGDAISQTMAATLLAFFRADSKDHYRGVDTTFAFKDFRRLNLAQLVGARATRVSHRTGLIAFDGIRISAPLELSVGRIDRVHAVMANAARSYRKVAFEGDERFVKSFNIRSYYPEAPFEARLIPICAPLRDRAGKITLSIAADDAAVDELTMHEVGEFSDTPVSVEFSDLLVETGTNLITYRAQVARHDRTNLVALYSQSSMA
jgi:hypothetical protein